MLFVIYKLESFDFLIRFSTYLQKTWCISSSFLINLSTLLQYTKNLNTLKQSTKDKCFREGTAPLLFCPVFIPCVSLMPWTRARSLRARFKMRMTCWTHGYQGCGYLSNRKHIKSLRRSIPTPGTFQSFRYYKCLWIWCLWEAAQILKYYNIKLTLVFSLRTK